MVFRYNFIYLPYSYILLSYGIRRLHKKQPMFKPYFRVVSFFDIVHLPLTQPPNKTALFEAHITR